jgi:hypothetical protein
MKHRPKKPLPKFESVVEGVPVSPSGGGLTAWVSHIMEDLSPLLAKAGLPSDLDGLAARKLEKKAPIVPSVVPSAASSAASSAVSSVVPSARHRRSVGNVTGAPPARYRLVNSVTSDNTPGDAAHEASMAVLLLVSLLQANTDLDRDPVVRMAFTAGVRLAELKAILSSQPPIKSKPRSPFFTLAKAAWDSCLAKRKAGKRFPQDKEIIAEMIALGMKENGDSLELETGKNRIHKIKTRTLLNNFTRWRINFTKWPES